MYLSFTAEKLLCVGTKNGYCIYNLKPFESLVKTGFLDSSIGIIEVLDRSNMLCLVGEKDCSRFPSNQVTFWSDEGMYSIGEIAVGKEITGVKLRKDFIFLATLERISVFNFAYLSPVIDYDTYDNPTGLMAVSSSVGYVTLVYPDTEQGWIRISQLSGSAKPEEKPIRLRAHDGPIACLAVSNCGAYVATASLKGTIIRIFNAKSLKLRELRRGTDDANISSMAFSPSASYLCVCSDSKTIHIFDLLSEDSKQKGASWDTKDEFDKEGEVLLSAAKKKFFHFLERSIIKITLPNDDNNCKCIFGDDNSTLFLASPTGYFYTITLDYKKNKYTISTKRIDLDD
ncbi:autophagy-related protein 18a [Aduncisulcus paluster]|uniref:Autophagy-related protein 18a n=1 Tax=Aduncisulcus paluster TaxID=2918883 RepID=A0ABQ5JQG3_9EUKA|nr:autophagy-related protein 18a [Aduncisulcus paluster]